ncbi:MAG: hypothetical protein HY304_07555 [candidate division Zixibacteria bacterium]|nr:hypothetical protein [candidate division Zixibacteria bacterium]
MRLAIALMVATVLGCQQKVEQKPPETATKTPQTQPETQPQAQPKTMPNRPPRPAMKQSDSRVWVDAVTAAKGSKGSFKINYYGVEEAKAIVVPLSYPAGMTVDSISFAGSILSYLANRPTRIENKDHFLLMTAIPMTEVNIPAKEGLLATVHFTLAPDATDGVIDETFVPPGNYLTYVDTASTLVEPRFEPGKMTVK